MKKKILLFSVSTFLLLTAIYILFEFIFSASNRYNTYCPFCDKKVVEYQKYFENDIVLGLISHRPVAKGHCLIIPKRHIDTFDKLNDEETLAISNLIKKTHLTAAKVLHADSFILLQKNGRNVGQTVPHIHFHYIPRKADEKFIFSFLLRFIINPFFSPISPKEMLGMTSAFGEAIKEF